MAGIAGSPYFDSYLYSQKLRCLDSSVHRDWFYMQAWDWTLEEIRCRMVTICNELQAGAIQSPIEPLSSNWHSDSISSSSLDGNQFTQSILRYGFLAAQTYKLVKM